MTQKVNVNNRSIERAGVPKDYKDCVAEYIWNSFDAKASKVEIIYGENGLGGLDYLYITDNGHGIDFENLNNTFGAFLDSQKQHTYQDTSYIRGKKGKGRFSFITFSSLAEWETIYKADENYYQYKITINSSNKDYYDPSDKTLSEVKQTGTKVSFYNFRDILFESINSLEFENYLMERFGWFLLLNKGQGYSISLNGKILDYNRIIADSEQQTFNIEDNQFLITYIRWKDKIGEYYYYYFLDEDKNQKGRVLTTFNNNAIGFHHSIYIESGFFNNFNIIKTEVDEQTPLIGESQNSNIYKILLKSLEEYMEIKKKNFAKIIAPQIINKYEREGVLPTFKNNKYDQQRKEDLKKVAGELFKIQPKLFLNLNKEQQKSFFGFLNLVLDTDERENIIRIMDNVVRLSSQERDDLCNVLRKTSLSRIINTMKMIENRYKAITCLKTLVFDLEKFTTERSHIQDTVAENYWLFGEEYNLVSADQNFEIALKEYLYIIDEASDPTLYKIENQDRLRRPDIFMCRKRNLEYTNNTELEENIIVELKEPGTDIGKTQFRQVEDYFDLILHEPRFNSQTRTWKFILVSNNVDTYIKALYDSFKDKNKRFLVHQKDNYEIYAMTWDDVFRTFEIRHRYLYEKLDFDKKAIEEELELRGIKLNRESSDQVRDRIFDLRVAQNA